MQELRILTFVSDSSKLYRRVYENYAVLELTTDEQPEEKKRNQSLYKQLITFFFNRRVRWIRAIPVFRSPFHQRESLTTPDLLSYEISDQGVSAISKNTTWVNLANSANAEKLFSKSWRWIHTCLLIISLFRRYNKKKKRKKHLDSVRQLNEHYSNNFPECEYRRPKQSVRSFFLVSI